MPMSLLGPPHGLLSIKGCHDAKQAMIIVIFSPEHQMIGTHNNPHPVVVALKLWGLLGRSTPL